MAARMASLDRSTTQALASSGAKWESFGNSVYDIGSKIASVGDTLTQSVTVPMERVGGYCVDQALKYDTSLANLNKTADLTKQELEDFGQAAIEASKTSPVTASQILDAEALGAQLGITSDKLQKFSDVANGLDIATSMDMETAATEMAQFANITGMSQDNLENYGSVIVDLGNHLATTEGDISHMSLRLAGMTTSAKFSQAEILGIAGAMSTMGIKAEAGGSAMTQIVANISKKVASGADEVEEFAKVAGMSADDFCAAWNERPMDALMEVIDGIHNLSENGQAADVTLSNLKITSIRQADAMRRLSGNTDVVHEAVQRANDAWVENNALTNEVNKRNESLQSRFDTLKNKVDAAATTVGVPFAEALLDVADDLEPLTTGIGDACQAFADMDEESQKQALALAGVAAAAGPVLSVTGRLVQGLGNVATAVGKAQTQMSILGDAYNTTDGAAVRVYGSTDSLATKLGVAGNKAVDAAGGAKNYVSAWEKMNDSAKVVATSEDKICALMEKSKTATDKSKASIERQVESLKKQRDAAADAYTSNARLVSGWTGSATEAKKAVKSAESVTKSFRDEGSSCKTLRDSLSEATGGFAALSSKSKAVESSGSGVVGVFKGIGSAAKGAVSGVTGLMGSFLEANAGAIALGALAAGIGYVATQWVEAKQHQDLFTAATRSMADVVGSAKGSVGDLGTSMCDLTPDVDGVLTSLKNLNDSVGSAFTSFYKSSALLDKYTATIDDLGNKSGLSASEQWRLKDAVDGYNKVCGTSYTVTDAANGKIADGTGNIVENTKALDDNAEAWKRQALAQAYSSKAAEYLETQAQAALELSKANEELAQKTQEYNDKQDDLNESVEKGLINQVDATAQLEPYKKAMDDAQGHVDELAESERSAGDDAAYLEQCATLAAAGISQDMVQALSGLPEQMQGMGQSIADSLGAGIQAGKVSTDDAARFVNDGIVGALQGLPDETKPFGLLAAQRCADGIADGSVSVDQAMNVMQGAATGGLDGIVAAYQQNGWELPEVYSQAIAAQATAPGESVSFMLSLVEAKLNGGDLQKTAKACGGNIDQGLSDAITKGTLSTEAAQFLGDDVINNLKDGLGVHSPSVYASEAGSYVDKGLEEGITGNQDGPLSAIASLGSSVVSGLSRMISGFFTAGANAASQLTGSITSGISGVPSSVGSTGQAASGAFASGVGSAVGAAVSSAASLASGVASGVAPSTGTLGTTGGNAGSSFASRLGSFSGAANSSGASLALGAYSGASPAATRLGNTGRSAGNSFANGVGSASGSARSSGSSLSSAASSGASGWSAYSSGSHLGRQFASGIGSAWNAVKSFASSLVNAAKSVMGFSVPKEGPWSGAEKGGVTSGYHLGMNFANGMALAVPAVRSAAMELSDAMAPAMASMGGYVPLPGGAAPTGSYGAGQAVNVVNNNVYINGTQVNNVSAHAQELISELFGEIGVVAGMR